jgi:hypothetical protein
MVRTLEVVAGARHYGIQPASGSAGGLGQEGQLRAGPGGRHGRAQAPSTSLPEVLVLHAASKQPSASRFCVAACGLDIAARRRLQIRARPRRLRCPEHGALVEGVTVARHSARFTRDFEDTVAWLATKTHQTAICRLVRIDWETVGQIIKRVGDELLREDRLKDLFDISLPGRARTRSPHLRTNHTHTPIRTTVRVTSPTIMPGELHFLEEAPSSHRAC